ncbi:hypothetical protein RI129_006224 [Pyrocoelia pectoralis]|uniref:Uncharacterized protein n=1 Tax=Pyrocoelia pectoralis TaxID=417401 RepID=A0AAN7VJH5_9COLE
MRLWLHTIILLTITGFSKAQHFIHLAILGALGLVGLWIMHTLLQDVNKLFSRPPLGPAKFFLVKRSVNEGDYFENGTLQDPMSNVSIDWNRILINDPVGCARSFVCQLAAEDPKLSSIGKEKIYYQLLRSTNRKGWAGKEIRFALNYGINSKKTQSCRGYYKYCPFSISTMRAVLHFLGAVA